MDVLDLFSGLGGWSKAFLDRGHNVVTIDIEKKFNPTICLDIMKINAKELTEGYGEFDVILASPPCNCFSVSSVYHHWDKITKRPKDEATYESIKLIGHTINLILNIFPRFWILENPRGMLRRVIGKPNATVTYCQYGKKIMKPTDLWGVFPKAFKPKSCKNKDKCRQGNPRSSIYGTQGINLKAFQKNKFSYLVKGGEGNSALRALIPYQLSMAVCLACEKELNEGIK